MTRSSKVLILGFLNKQLPTLILILLASSFLSYFRMHGTTYIEPITNSIEAGTVGGLGRLIFWACLFQTLFYFLRFAVSYLAGRLNELFAVHIRLTLFGHLNDISYRDFEKRQAGDLQSLIRNDSQNASRMLHIFFSRIVMNLFIIGVSSAYMWSLDYKSTILFLALSLGLGYINFLIAKRVKAYAFSARNSFGKLSDMAARCCSVLDSVKLYGAADYLRSFFNEQRDDFNRHKLHREKVYALGRVIQSLTYNLTTFGCAILLGFRVMDDLATMGTVLVYISLLIQVSVGFTTIFGWMPVLAVAAAALDRIEEVMTIPEQNGAKEIPRAESLDSLELREVDFRFDPGEPLLDGIDLSFRKGRSYQITGQSGSGKTTLLKILLGLYEAEGSRLLLDGKAGQRPSIGYVPSDPGIFNVSLFDNITMGDKSVTPEACEAAARKLGALEWIESLPGRFDYGLKENGKNLSGGQKQMIALMRVLAKDYPVIVMDEPFSALDSSREADLIETMGRLKKDRILIYTSHRESTSVAADELVRLDRS